VSFLRGVRVFFGFEGVGLIIGGDTEPLPFFGDPAE
jgi:hypothetical protein